MGMLAGMWSFVCLRTLPRLVERAGEAVIANVSRAHLAHLLAPARAVHFGRLE